MTVEANRCPVCQARFRGASICSRCGADLSRLMRLSAESWKLREQARAALAQGAGKRALTLASHAQETLATPGGKTLQRLAAWLVT